MFSFTTNAKGKGKKKSKKEPALHVVTPQTFHAPKKPRGEALTTENTTAIANPPALGQFQANKFSFVNKGFTAPGVLRNAEDVNKQTLDPCNFEQNDSSQAEPQVLQSTISKFCPGQDKVEEKKASEQGQEVDDKKTLDLNGQSLEPENTPAVQPLAEHTSRQTLSPLHEEVVAEPTKLGVGEGDMMQQSHGVLAQEEQTGEPFSASKYFDTDKENLTKFFKESVEGMDAIAQQGEAVARNMLDLKQAITNKRKALELALMS